MWFKFHWTCGLLCWFVPVAVACAKMDLLVTMHLMLCVLRLTTIPKLPGTMDQKDSNVRDEVQSKRQKLMDELEIDIPELRGWSEGSGSCVYACKAQASARVDVPTAPEVVPGYLRQCARREGLEVRLSREWVRAFLVSIDLSYNSAAQRRGLSTSVPRPNRCCKRSSATFLQHCDVGLMLPSKVDAIVMMSNELTDTLHRIWQSFPRCLGAT